MNMNEKCLKFRLLDENTALTLSGTVLQLVQHHQFLEFIPEKFYNVFAITVGQQNRWNLHLFILKINSFKVLVGFQHQK